MASYNKMTPEMKKQAKIMLDTVLNDYGSAEDLARAVGLSGVAIHHMKIRGYLSPIAAYRLAKKRRGYTLAAMRPDIPAHEWKKTVKAHAERAKATSSVNGRSRFDTKGLV